MTSTALEKRYLGQSETPEIQVARAEGSYIFDANGKKYIDFVMGWCVGNFGWRPAAIASYSGGRFSGARAATAS